jgi:uncharacterized secreted repeat protein (TIGR03808 family)
MRINRRHFFTAAAATLAAPSALAAPLSRFGLDAANFGVRPGAVNDQSQVLQAAIDQAATARVPLMLAPGVYRASGLRLASGAALVGVRGATRLVLSGETAMLTANKADAITLTGLTLDGRHITLPANDALVNLTGASNLRITDCVIDRAGGHGVLLIGCAGEVSGTSITNAADTALFSRDGLGLTISGNTIHGSGNGGIRVWQSQARDDGSSVFDNRISKTFARAGGSGQNGNAINIYQANNVVIRGNHIRDAAFSAIRGNAASSIQIIGNNCAALNEVAIYSEFAFEAAVIADNIVDGAEVGISVTNFDDGGHLSAVHGNLIRNVGSRRVRTPLSQQGIGIAVEADTTVSGNTIEGAANIGIRAGWGTFLRDVAITGNVVRGSNYGVAISVVPGAGAAVVSGNMIGGALRAGVVGMAYKDVATGDLTKGGAEAYPQLKIADNQIS